MNARGANLQKKHPSRPTWSGEYLTTRPTQRRGQPKKRRQRKRRHLGTAPQTKADKVSRAVPRPSAKASSDATSASATRGSLRTLVVQSMEKSYNQWNRNCWPSLRRKRTTRLRGKKRKGRERRRRRPKRCNPTQTNDYPTKPHNASRRPRQKRTEKRQGRQKQRDGRETRRRKRCLNTGIFWRENN